MSISRMLTLKFEGQESNAWPHIPAIIICRVNNRVIKTSAFVADILISCYKSKIKTPNLLSELNHSMYISVRTHGTVV
jgi:hypothetical protein